MLVCMWLDECARCEPRHALAKGASRHTHAGVERAEWFPLSAINPLDSFNKGLEIMFYVQKGEKKSPSTVAHAITAP